MPSHLVQTFRSDTVNRATPATIIPIIHIRGTSEVAIATVLVPKAVLFNPVVVPHKSPEALHPWVCEYVPIVFARFNINRRTIKPPIIALNNALFFAIMSNYRAMTTFLSAILLTEQPELL